MGTFGPNNGNTFASDATLGVVAITNPTNAQFTDATYATAVLLGTQISNYLKATNFNFTIPNDATITGVTLSVIRHSTVGSTLNDNSVRLVKGGIISGNDKASATSWPTSDAPATYGSSTDLWGLSFIPSDINSTSFGVVISAVTTLAATADMDSVFLTVDYTGSNKPGNELRQMKVGDGMSRSEVAN